MDELPAPRSALCVVAGCAQPSSTRCAYEDEHGQECSTDWCIDHVKMIDGHPYCRRHAGVATALATADTHGHIPDIDNRAASLANWVGNDLDSDFQALLGQTCHPEIGETVVAEPITYTLTAYRTHLWMRTWKIVNASSDALTVTVDVDEANDSEVRLRVDTHTVMSIVPPWIGRRYNAPQFASNDQARREFYSTIVAAAGEAIRTRSPRPASTPL